MMNKKVEEIKKISKYTQKRLRRMKIENRIYGGIILTILI